jgi:cation transport regulator
MPYRSNGDLPISVRAHLPPEAQDIYRGAFNSAWQEYAHREPERLEEIAHRVAWAAVKRRFHKADGEWAPNALRT